MPHVWPILPEVGFNFPGLRNITIKTGMPISPARVAAFDVLLRVERDSAYASELLHSHAYERLSPKDHALLTELVMGVLRWRSRLDAEISHASAQSIAKLDLEVLTALRLAVYQFHWLDRVPQRAAVHESVELVKRAHKRSAAGFVNAVLRKLAATTEKDNHERETGSEGIAETWAHPAWLVERWIREYGNEATQAICKYDQSIPTVSVRLRNHAAEGELKAAQIGLEPGTLLSFARHVHSADITKTEAFRKGEIVIQDEASQLVAVLVGRGQHILDCCAAPGGKTLAIADYDPAAHVTAVEIHPHRARLLRKLLGDAASGRIKTIVADARNLPLSQGFDRVLADVPCSGTGTLARNPEIKWRLRPDDLPDLQERQVAILRSALPQVAPRGRLVYSTCSLEREENEDVVEKALAASKGFRTFDCRVELDRLKASGDLIWPTPARLTRGPYLRTIPGIHPCEGFFAAIVERDPS